MDVVTPRPASGGALLYVRCFWTAAPPIGGNCTTRGFDTPATRRKKASCSAKPPSPARRTPGHGGLGRTAHERCQGAAPTHWHEHYARARHYSPNNNHAGPLGYKTLPARVTRPTSGTKLAQHEPHGPTSGTKLAQHIHPRRMCGTKLSPHTRPRRISGTKLSPHTRPRRMCGTKLSPHTHPHRISGTKLSPHTRNSSIWRCFCMQGEFYTVLTAKKLSRENFVPNARQSWG